MERRWSCTYCEKAFLKKIDVDRHELIHTGVKNYVCAHPGCESRFTTKSALTEHTRIHTGERPYECTIEGCNERFVNTSRRNVHVQSKHLKERRFQCDVCSKTFVLKNCLNTHYLKHTTNGNGKSFACTAEGCNKRYTWNDTLQRHIRTFHQNA
jgi:uncharacterized Zn-finger protein